MLAFVSPSTAVEPMLLRITNCRFAVEPTYFNLIKYHTISYTEYKQYT